jgi:hypothetical protein
LRLLVILLFWLRMEDGPYRR